MKTDWNTDELKITWDNPHPKIQAKHSNYNTYMTTSTAIDNDIYDAIRYAAMRSIDMKEKTARGAIFDELERTLRKMGIFLTEIRQDSYNDYAEITCKVNPIDWYISLDGMNEKRNDLRIKKAANFFPRRSHPKKVIFCGPATTILWTDGTKTTVKCSGEDVWEDEVGIAMCYLKKMLGNKGNYNNIFREAMKVAVVMELKDIPDSIPASATDSGAYVSSAFNDMSENIDKINKYMKDAADALSKAVKEKK